MSKLYDIISAGEMLIDFTPCKEAYTYTANPGGAPANVAVSVSRNGLKAGFLGMLGNDDFGKRLQATLIENKVKPLCNKLTDEAVTTLAFVTLYDNGERSFTFTRKPGADILIRPDDFNMRDVENCTIFNAGSFSLTHEPARSTYIEAIKKASKAGAIISFDINYRDAVWHSEANCLKVIEEILPYVDLLKISDEELFFVGGEKNIDSFMDEYKITAVIETLGSKGSKYYYNGKSGVLESMKVKAVDATGAGDAFWGGFLSNLVMQKVTSVADINEVIIEAALKYGNTSGGLCVTKMGGIPGIPTKEDIYSAMLK